MSDKTEKSFQALMQAQQEYAVKEKTESPAELIKLMTNIIALAQKYAQLRKEAVEKAKKEYDKYNTKLKKIEDDLSGYFDIEEEATSEEKAALKKAQEKFEVKKQAYFNQHWLYEGNKSPEHKTTGALEILEKANRDLANLKVKAKPAKERAEEQRELERLGAEKQKAIEIEMLKRRVQLTENKKEKKELKAQLKTLESKEQYKKDPVKKLDMSKFKGGAVEKLYAARRPAMPATQHSPVEESSPFVPPKRDSHIESHTSETLSSTIPLKSPPPPPPPPPPRNPKPLRTEQSAPSTAPKKSPPPPPPRNPKPLQTEQSAPSTAPRKAPPPPPPRNKPSEKMKKSGNPVPAIARHRLPITKRKPGDPPPMASRSRPMPQKPSVVPTNVAPTLLPRDHGASTAQAYKKMVIDNFLKSHHYLKGTSLEKRILSENPKVKLSTKEMQYINFVQTTLDLLYADTKKTSDEKGEIMGGLIMNIEQQLKSNKHSPLKKIVENWSRTFSATDYTGMSNQASLLAFMGAAGLSVLDQETFKLFAEQSRSVIPTNKAPAYLLTQLRSVEQAPIPDKMKAQADSIIRFNESLWPYLEPQSPASTLQTTIQKRYQQKGGTHNKKGSIREGQINLLQSYLEAAYTDNNYSAAEKGLLLSGILENFHMQLKGDGRGSKLLKILGELEKIVPEDAKHHSKQQIALLTEAFIKEHKIGATNPLAKKAFDEACESIKQPQKRPRAK
ncbi:hypothetical protein CC99x_008980 [Candidatus Berkiella cookevillensis]|uniref:Uncharacterized protein n=1 Tax=Candidatus Berkiella cookevillensis TaxID=437022 RepID=A0A0Q9YJL4_9GAMM|nr:hypothetical protein [Candidatus Berkiella cookevillensis]MCS5709035.1 hypothetical protein [Candidatus Berkiella cookevillensis]